MPCLIKVFVEFLLLFGVTVLFYAGVWQMMKKQRQMFMTSMVAIALIMYGFVWIWRIL